MKKLRIILIIAILYGAMIPANLIIRDIFIGKAQAAEVLTTPPPGTLTYRPVLVLHFSQLTTPTPAPTSAPTALPTPTPTVIPEVTAWPTVSPTEIPTPTPLSTPEFCYPCAGELIRSYGYPVSWTIPLWTCPTAHRLQNREQVIEFAQWDDTDKRDNEGWNCVGYVDNMIKNAESNSVDAGIACYQMEGWGGNGHVIVYFDTTEDGIVYVDPTWDDQIYEPVLSEDAFRGNTIYWYFLFNQDRNDYIE